MQTDFILFIFSSYSHHRSPKLYKKIYLDCYIKKEKKKDPFQVLINGNKIHLI